MKSKLIIALLLVSINFVAQVASTQWAVNIGGASYDQGFSVTTDINNNVYSTGIFRGTVDFDPGPGVFTVSAVSGAYDIYIVKLDANSNFVWAKTMGGSLSEYPNTIALNANGDIYLTGYYDGLADFDPSASSYTLQSQGSTDAFISKYDNNGNFIWAKSFGSTSNDVSWSLAVDLNGNSIITGGFIGTVDFDPGPSVLNVTSVSGSTDVFVSKFDTNGNLVWSKTMGGIAFEEARSVALDSLGNVLTTGYFFNTGDYDPSAATFTLGYTGVNSTFISKLDANGNFIWAKALNGSSTVYGYSIKTGPFGSVWVGGSFSGGCDFDPGPGTFSVNGIASQDIFVAKFNSLGNFIWAKTIGSTNDEVTTSIDVDSLSNVYLTGNFYGIVDFDPSASTFTLGAGSNEIFVSKLDNNGNFVWASQSGWAGADMGNAVHVDDDLNVYSTGYFSTTGYFSPPPTITLTSNGFDDAFIHKISQCSVPQNALNTTPIANHLICTGNNTTLMASSPTGTVTWYASPTSTTILVSGNIFVTPTLSTGTYTYYIEVETCTTSISRTPITVTVSACTGIKELVANTGSFNLYPNPAANIVTIESIQPAQYFFINIEGKVMEKYMAEGNLTIDLSKFTQGVYFIKNATTGETKKMIIINE
jgi:hypothetical protein